MGVVFSRLAQLPVFLIIALIYAGLMLIPALHGFYSGESHIGRSFTYSALLIFITIGLMSLAISNRRAENSPHKMLFNLLLAFIAMPLILAIPFYEALKTTTIQNAYFEMVSSMTTTGFAQFDAQRLPPVLHLWRGVVAWFGGVLIWVAALSIFAPLRLGGYEMVSASYSAQHAQAQGPVQSRFLIEMRQLLPIYTGLTVVLTIALLLTGLSPFASVMAAMGTMSTSGILGENTNLVTAGVWQGELLVSVFFIFAVTRRLFEPNKQGWRVIFQKDSELRLMAALMVLVLFVLFFRHFWGAYTVDSDALFPAVKAAWGIFFTCLSFLTSTGFVSQEWANAQGWSGLGSPGLILMALAAIGGGVATTAGGIKLLRIATLLRHSRHEIEQLLHPSAISSGADDLRIKSLLAWVSFMGFVLAVSAVLLLLSLWGNDFEDAIVLAISALANCGPLAVFAAEQPISLGPLSDAEKGIIAVAMILGRLETLALVALFSADFWRR